MKTYKGIGIILLAVVLLVVATVFLITREEEAAPEDNKVEQQLNGISLTTFELNDQPVKGDREAPIQIVEIGDYKCPSCKTWTESVYPELETSYINSGQAAFYYINEAFLGPDSLYAAMAGEYILEKHGDDAFWKLHHELIAHQGNKDEEWANIEFLTQLVKEHLPEVDSTDFQKALEQHAYEPQVKKDLQISSQVAVERVPSIYVNGILVDGMSYENVQAVIEAELKRIGPS